MTIKNTYYGSIFEVEFESLPEELKEVAIRSIEGEPNNENTRVFVTVEHDDITGTRTKITIESLYSNGETDIAEAYIEQV